MGMFRSFLCVVIVASLLPSGQAGDFQDSLSHRRALFRVRQDERMIRKAMEKMDLLPWQREAISLLLDEQNHRAQIFRLASDLRGRDFEAKIQEVITVTRHGIQSALRPEQRTEWLRLATPGSLTFAARQVLVGEIPDGGPDH